jgi:NAD(P)-dependent dehydrogenase (short-subunit alcohol dehydrogenase family)
MNLVLTGSSTGIGRALASHLLSRGHLVWGLARSDQSDFASQHPGTFFASRCDVADWAQVQSAATAVTAAWPHIDGLICCAGIQGEVGAAITADPLNWSATVRANLDGTFYPFRAFHPLLARAPRRAKVIAFSGGGATKPRVNFSAYGVAKTGVVRLIETLAEELRDQPIDLNTIAPGAINTRLTDEVLALGPTVAGPTEYAAAVKQKASGGASLDKALGLVEWLLSPASDSISGRLLAAPWDPWPTLDRYTDVLAQSDIYTLRRIVPGERSRNFAG